MANANVTTLTIAGDASSLVKATKTATDSTKKMSDTVDKSGGVVSKSFGKMASGAVFLTQGLSNVSDAVGTFRDLSRDSAIRADRLARAELAVSQAAVDLNQSLLDATQAQLDFTQAQQDATQAGLDVEQAYRDQEQASLDVGQAQLDAESAQRDYTDAINEFGSGSLEARQALQDLQQAQQDLQQALGDSKQAQADVTQAQQDASQATADQEQALLDTAQAALDSEGAQLDYNEALRGAVPPSAIEEWAEKLEKLSPLLFTAIGAMQLFTSVTTLAAVKQGIVSAATAVWTGVQWLLNVALTANPIGLLIVGIGLLIAGIVLLWNNSEGFRKFFIAMWEGIKKAAMAVWDWLKGAWDWLSNAFDWLVDKFKKIPENLKNNFVGLFNIITSPFRAAFNFISDIWNNTIGKLSWSVPSWVPVVGGNTISAPKLPHFHQGGTVPGLPGQEVLAVLQAGETVTPAGQSSGNVVIEIRSGGSDVDDVLVKVLQRAIKVRGGNVQLALGR